MSRSFFKLPIKLRALAAVGCMAAILAPAACSSGSSGSNTPGVVTVAVVANPLITGQMVPLTKSVFQKQYPGIKVKFVTYTEGDLRAAIERDVSTHSNAFNVIMIGPYETPLFAKNGWLVNMTKQFFPKSPSYAPGDLLPPIAQSLSYNGGEYAVPFYGESSMLYYRTDLFAKAHLTMPVHPTWAQVQSFAAKLNQPGKLAGVCLRGLAGWGDNMASLRCLQRQLQPAADAVRPGQVRDVVRRHGGGDLHRRRLPGHRQADRVRLRAGEAHQVVRLAVDVVARHPDGRRQPV